MKYLLWALLIYLAWRWYETKKANAAEGTAASAGTSEESAEPMVRCAECGVYLPLSESVRGEALTHYCCDAHRARHPGG